VCERMEEAEGRLLVSWRLLEGCCSCWPCGVIGNRIFSRGGLWDFQVKLAFTFVRLVKDLCPILSGASLLLLSAQMGALLSKVVGGTVAGVNHVGSFTQLCVVHM